MWPGKHRRLTARQASWQTSCAARSEELCMRHLLACHLIRLLRVRVLWRVDKSIVMITFILL